VVHMELDAQLRGMSESSGVDSFGVADLSVASDATLEQGGSAIASLLVQSPSALPFYIPS